MYIYCIIGFDFEKYTISIELYAQKMWMVDYNLGTILSRADPPLPPSQRIRNLCTHVFTNYIWDTQISLRQGDSKMRSSLSNNKISNAQNLELPNLELPNLEWWNLECHPLNRMTTFRFALYKTWNIGNDPFWIQFYSCLPSSWNISENVAVDFSLNSTSRIQEYLSKL